ncbi:MAG: DinB family protein [Acidobacteria bacterium]|nr:DinB family protein [Acidobacteriota bacterium]
MARPEKSEHLAYFSTYIDKVEGDDALAVMRAQIDETIAALQALGEARCSLPAAPGKWTIKQAIGHLIDTERVFGYRALRFARNDQTPLAGFEQDDWAPNAPYDRYTLEELIAEFRAVRAATIALFAKLTPEEMLRSGPVSGNTHTVRALAFMIAGHEIHHRRLLPKA